MIDNDPAKDGSAPETSPEDEEQSARAPKGADDLPPAAKEELTSEEQMAKFEDALKDEDWGHQPC